MSATLSRTARVLLLLSLALNVALVSALVLRAPWRHPPHEVRHAGPLPGLVDLRAFRRSLPPDRHAAIDAAFAARRDQLRPRLIALFDARRAVRTAIAAEPFDRATLDAAFVRLRAAESEAASEAQALFGDVLAGASAEERRRLAELMPLRAGRDRGREREPRGRPDAPPPPEP